MNNIIKKEFIGFLREHFDGCSFETETEYFYIPLGLIDRLLGITTQDGDKFKITIEKLN